jgi:carboxymethylenebutenolidase
MEAGATMIDDSLRQHVVVYPEVPHGFHADYQPSYRKEMAGDGWNRLLAWFKKFGVV